MLDVICFESGSLPLVVSRGLEVAMEDIVKKGRAKGSLKEHDYGILTDVCF